MAVTETVALPAQPVVGATTEVPLAGDGYYAPHSQTNVRINLDADVSSGNITAFIEMDPRWTSIVAWAALEVASMAATRQANFRILSSENISMSSMQLITQSTLGNAAEFNGCVWVPPPFILPGPIRNTTSSIRVGFLNTDSEDIIFDCVIYNFQKDVRNRVPLQWIHSSLPRGLTSA